MLEIVPHPRFLVQPGPYYLPPKVLLFGPDFVCPPQAEMELLGAYMTPGIPCILPPNEPVPTIGTIILYGSAFKSTQKIYRAR